MIYGKIWEIYGDIWMYRKYGDLWMFTILKIYRTYGDLWENLGNIW